MSKKITNDSTVIDDYISLFEPAVQSKLNQLRAAIKEAAPDATEKISYKMPTFHQNGNLVYFAAYEKHIGFYPTGSCIIEFADEIKDFKTSKGTIQLPLDKDLPLDLIQRIVIFRVAENLAKKKTTKKS